MATNGASFRDFGEYFQELVLHAMLVDHVWARQMIEVLDVDYFELKHLSYLSQRYFEYAKKYKVFPTLELLASIVKDDLRESRDTALRDNVLTYMNKVFDGKHLNDLPHAKDKSLDFCKRQALLKALEKSIPDIEHGQYEAVVTNLKKAITVGNCVSVGHELLEDYDSRYTPMQRHPVTTGHKQIDKVTHGGLGGGELGFVVAPTGVGKCVDRTTYVHVRFSIIKINGKSYKPWELVQTQRGSVRADSVLESDDLV